MKKIIIYLATMLLAAMTFTGCYDLETYTVTSSASTIWEISLTDITII